VNGISSGDYHLNSFVESNDEIGILSKALKDSYSKISEYTAYINTVAYKDSLTGLKNSTAYAEATEKLNHEIAHGKPKFGILVADVNNLKNTNDTYGHGTGNELIIHSAKILADTFRTSTVYRIGGDEFVVILKGNDLECYPMLIKKMDEAFSREYITVNDQSVSVSAATGSHVRWVSIRLTSRASARASACPPTSVRSLPEPPAMLPGAAAMPVRSAPSQVCSMSRKMSWHPMGSVTPP